MKKIFIGGSLSFIFFFMVIITANAENAFYTNSNGVEMNETQYNKMLEIFPEKKVKILTQEEFNKYKDATIIDSDSRFEKIIYDGDKKISSEIITEEQFKKESLNGSSYDTKGSNDSDSHETSYKKLMATILEVNGSFDLVANLDWKKIPARRSYDVFAFYLNNLHHNSFGGTQTYYTSTGSNNIFYNTSSPGYKGFSNGAGVSMNLKDGTNIVDYVLSIGANLSKTTTNAYGRVYVSYQHCQSDITRAQSKSYILNLSGLGNVVYYSDSWLMNTYDGMGGVSLRVDI